MTIRSYQTSWVRLLERTSIARRAPCRSTVLVLATVAICFAPILGGCHNDSENSDVVAKVGPEHISAEEFRLSYGLGFPHLTRGPASSRENYLQRMIDERLLALEGSRIGLHETDEVRRKVSSMRAELLVERIFQQEVNDQVVVTESIVREAIGRVSVRFKLRYLPAASPEHAVLLRAKVASEGFEAAARTVASTLDVPGIVDSFESPYLTANEIDETLLLAIADLEPGNWSDPVSFRGAYILVQVLDVRRDVADAALDPQARDRIEHVQFLREAKRLTREFVTTTMQPHDLRIKPRVYNRLRNNLWEWLSQEPPPNNLFHALKQSGAASADSLRALLPELLMTTRDEEWTVERFLLGYPADRYPLSVDSRQSFESDLFDAFGLAVRDRVLVAMAEDRGMDGEKNFETELRSWTNKFVYRALYNFIADTVTVSQADVREYFRRHRQHYSDSFSFEHVEAEVTADAKSARVAATITSLLDRLRETYPVVIERDVLDHVDIPDPRAPSEPPVTVLKGHTGRFAYPVVDPHW